MSRAREPEGTNEETVETTFKHLAVGDEFDGIGFSRRMMKVKVGGLVVAIPMDGERKGVALKVPNPDMKVKKFIRTGG